MIEGNFRFDISIHALREEGDCAASRRFIMRILFLSTPSARRATPAGVIQKKRGFISIHALREEGDFGKVMCFKQIVSYFYPRPPRGGRLDANGNLTDSGKFLSTPSARRATGADLDALELDEFLSTPSARRATQFFDHRDFIQHDFYPRPPRGGRLAGVSRMI